MARERSTLARAHEILERALATPRRGILRAGMVAPASTPGSAWLAWPEEASAAYLPPEGPALFGFGRAAEFRSSGRGIAAPLKWARAVARSGAPREESVVFCGCAFSPRGAGQGAWAGFPALRLLLPRWTYRLEAERATLSLALTASDPADPGGRRLHDELDRLWAGLVRPSVAEAPPRATLRQLPPRRWNALAGGALRAISSGRFEKLVPARSAVARGARRWEAGAVLQALARAPGCTAFAFQEEGRSTFIGATPERLVARSGRRLLTEALAGTVRRGEGYLDLQTAKTVNEHELVAREIVRRLRPVCSSVSRDPAVARGLADMVHLKTRIEGRLRKNTHVLELGLRLHPTPAVSGLPTRAAVRWLDANEAEPRGWYAGFVGWFDGTGDGELSVAIRSGLLRGKEARLFTGAGMVLGSTVAGEYDETALKQRPFLRALGMAK